MLKLSATTTEKSLVEVTERTTTERVARDAEELPKYSLREKGQGHVKEKGSLKKQKNEQDGALWKAGR